ncbi:hypothetical protein GCM10010206_14640 [Streptomyces cinerochromogenes]|nr:hypothetical protein GCM10010206_14640 [Streptomyces cinerochromogenes]
MHRRFSRSALDPEPGTAVRCEDVGRALVGNRRADGGPTVAVSGAGVPSTTIRVVCRNDRRPYVITGVSHV